MSSCSQQSRCCHSASQHSMSKPPDLHELVEEKFDEPNFRVLRDAIKTKQYTKDQTFVHELTIKFSLTNQNLDFVLGSNRLEVQKILIVGREEPNPEGHAAFFKCVAEKNTYDLGWNLSWIHEFSYDFIHFGYIFWKKVIFWRQFFSKIRSPSPIPVKLEKRRVMRMRTASELAALRLHLELKKNTICDRFSPN